jgi:hypothetical protein
MERGEILRTKPSNIVQHRSVKTDFREETSKNVVKEIDRGL